MTEWILGAIILYLVARTLRLSQQVEQLDGLVRYLRIQANTSEANISTLYYLRSIEVQVKNPTLTDEDLSAYRQDLEDTNSILYGQNKDLIEDSKRKK